MSTLPEHIVIFFADVIGSTQLYEKLGDSLPLNRAWPSFNNLENSRQEVFTS